MLTTDLLMATVTESGKSDYTENELVLPALLFIAERSQGMRTTELIRVLTDLLHPSGHDATPSSSRADSHFSQKVRNLKCHDKLMRLGVANYRSGIWHITDRDRAFLDDNATALYELRRQGFGRLAGAGGDGFDYRGLWLMCVGLRQLPSRTPPEA